MCNIWNIQIIYLIIGFIWYNDIKTSTEEGVETLDETWNIHFDLTSSTKDIHFKDAITKERGAK